LSSLHLIYDRAPDAGVRNEERTEVASRERNILAFQAKYAIAMDVRNAGNAAQGRSTGRPMAGMPFDRTGSNERGRVIPFRPRRPIEHTAPDEDVRAGPREVTNEPNGRAVQLRDRDE